MVNQRFESQLPDPDDEPVDPPAPAISEVGTTVAPHTIGFNRRRINFEVDLAEVFSQPRNGLRIPRALDPALAREERYQQFLFRAPNATRPEFMVHEALERRGLLSPFSDPPGFDFDYQVPLLGGRELGGAVVDFVIESIAPPVVLRIQGEFFHFADDETEARDIVQKLAIKSLGFTVVDIVAQDTLTEERVNQVLHSALLGFELDTSGRQTQF
jgi:very-short-patch-repair endonuclease